jgi:hypothetical protein
MAGEESYPFRVGDVVTVQGSERQAAVAFVTGGWAKLDRNVNGHEWYHFTEIAFAGRNVHRLRVA